jgi:hypothetical protein
MVMTTMATRPCAGPGSRQPCPTRAVVRGRPTGKQAARCPTCSRQWQRARNAARPERRTTEYRRYMDEAKAAWLAMHGPLCLGWAEQPAHMVTAAEITMDHVHSLAIGGDPLGRVVGRCRPCNSARGAAA